ncbi:MAG: hypothetical protein LBH75_05095 [Treponema sp.]|jgi:hypothetical protein|nr:hypothetical protein [Treponema sp.]
MKKIAIILAISAVIFAGCIQEELTPEDIPLENQGGTVGGGAGDDENADPRNGKILDEGLAYYLMRGGIDELDEGTYDTPETIGRTLDADFDGSIIGTATPGGETYAADDDSATRAKYIVRGPSSVSTSKLDSGGFTDVAFLYYKEPLEGEFTLRARVLITAKAGDSSSKGYFFGAFTGEPILDGGAVAGYKELPNTTSLGAGILYRTNDTADNNSGGPSMRPYFKQAADGGGAGGWSTGPSKSSAESGSRLENWMNFRQPGWRQERILEVIRENRPHTADNKDQRISVFVLNVYDSKSEKLLETVYIYDNAVNENLFVGKPVYAGIALLGTSVEVSEISLWNTADKSGDPLLQTPRTTPAYVAVDSVKIRASRVVSTTTSLTLETHPDLPGADRIRGTPLAVNYISGGIELTPVFSPDYADNEYFDWDVVFPFGKDEGALENITLEKIDGEEDLGWKKARVWITAAGSYFIMVTSRDSGRADWVLEIRVR